jgi:hypothetical protein
MSQCHSAGHSDVTRQLKWSCTRNSRELHSNFQELIQLSNKITYSFPKRREMDAGTFRHYELKIVDWRNMIATWY